MPRVVSLLPAGTEIVYALGAGGFLVGRSHECDFPPEASRLPVVSKPALALEGRSPEEVDRAVADRLASGDSLYTIDERLLAELAPDLILTQNLCQVCAPSGNELSRAVATLPTRPDLVWLTPRTLAEIDENILTVGEALGRGADARAVVATGRARLARVAERLEDVEHRPRVAFLEWTDPPYCAGHWVPEMVALAGGDDRLGRAGADSVRVTWDDVRASAPEIVVVAPCGCGLAEAEKLARTLPEFAGARVIPVDANAYFARPGPRTAEGVELLARLFHPERFSGRVWAAPRVDAAPNAT